MHNLLRLLLISSLLFTFQDARAQPLLGGSGGDKGIIGDITGEDDDSWAPPNPFNGGDNPSPLPDPTGLLPGGETSPHKVIAELKDKIASQVNTIAALEAQLAKLQAEHERLQAIMRDEVAGHRMTQYVENLQRELVKAQNISEAEIRRRVQEQVIQYTEVVKANADKKLEEYAVQLRNKANAMAWQYSQDVQRQANLIGSKYLNDFRRGAERKFGQTIARLSKLNGDLVRDQQLTHHRLLDLYHGDGTPAGNPLQGQSKWWCRWFPKWCGTTEKRPRFFREERESVLRRWLLSKSEIQQIGFFAFHDRFDDTELVEWKVGAGKDGSISKLYDEINSNLKRSVDDWYDRQGTHGVLFTPEIADALIETACQDTYPWFLKTYDFDQKLGMPDDFERRIKGRSGRDSRYSLLAASQLASDASMTLEVRIEGEPGKGKAGDKTVEDDQTRDWMPEDSSRTLEFLNWNYWLDDAGDYYHPMSTIKLGNIKNKDDPLFVDDSIDDFLDKIATLSDDILLRLSTANGKDNAFGVNLMKSLDTWFMKESLVEEAHERLKSRTIKDAKSSRSYAVDPTVVITPEIEKKVADIADEYHKANGFKVIITSGTRKTSEQSSEMLLRYLEGEEIIYRSEVEDLSKEVYSMLKTEFPGLKGIGKGAKEGIAQNVKGNESSAASKIKKILDRQVADQKYLSLHLDATAADVVPIGVPPTQFKAELDKLEAIAKSQGAKPHRHKNKDDHVHVSFPK